MEFVFKWGKVRCKSHVIGCLAIAVSWLTACQSADQSVPAETLLRPIAELEVQFPREGPPDRIADYIRQIYQDDRGRFWFGTNGRGVAHFDGDSLRFFSVNDGFDGEQVNGITRSTGGDLWFATNRGAVMLPALDSTFSFVNFPASDHFDSRKIWSIYADDNEQVWASTSRGVYLFDGKSWQAFALPGSPTTVWSISQDRRGNYWFGTDGEGAVRYDEEKFEQLTAKDGLSDNSVDVVFVAEDGRKFMGTRYGGLSIFDGKSFTSYETPTIGNDEVCAVFQDSAGSIWFSSEGYGVYRLSDDELTNYSLRQGLGVRAVQTIFEDRDGRIWVGGGGGLYRLEGERFVHVGRDGPWE